MGFQLLNLVEVIDELEGDRDEITDYLKLQCRLNLAQVDLD